MASLTRVGPFSQMFFSSVPGRGSLGALCACLVLIGLGASPVPSRAASASPSREACLRPSPGAAAAEPENVRSVNGVLNVALTITNDTDAQGVARFCYLLPDGTESPTLRLKPGDLLILRLKNALSQKAPDPKSGHQHAASSAPGADPCTSGIMSLSSANLHFHGLNVAPVCHQDEVIRTSVQPGEAFEYRFRIPEDEPPGLYWYHPHVHGFSSRQVLGGASGALIVEGIERALPDLAGLPERVLVIRDRDLMNPGATPSPNDPTLQGQIDRDGDALNTGTGTGQPAKDLSINYVPVPYPDYPTATVAMKPGQRELWRVLNASSVTYLNVAALYKRGGRFKPEMIGVVAVDGAPIGTGNRDGHSLEWRDGIVLSPGARVEFILTGPPSGVPAMLVTRAVDTGAGGENDPNRPLLTIVGTPDAPATRSHLPEKPQPLPESPAAWLGGVTPVRTRKLFFSEDAPNPARPNDAKFYLTVEGQTPATFDPASTEPNIVLRQGDVEDWIIENRTTELHAFHIHQVRFQVREWQGFTVNEPFLRDTINIPFFSAYTHGYPTVRLRMDFRSPNTVGTFVYHCHLLDHEDGGMMGLIRVDPADPAPAETRHLDPIRVHEAH
jgi:FtsP/CotA-like multicopper oxidase with cupredoxin domain